MEEPIYHFITGGLLKKWNVDPRRNYSDILIQDRLLAKNFRSTVKNSCFLSDLDPPEDSNYIFCTGDRTFLERAIETFHEMDKRPYLGIKTADNFNDVIMGFILDARRLRNKDEVLFRTVDIQADEGSITIPFTNQEITPHSEVLIYKELKLSPYLIGTIENNVRVYPCIEYIEDLSFGG